MNRIVQIAQQVLRPGRVARGARERVWQSSDHHAAHAGVFADAAKSLGGTGCTSLNPKITGYLIDPLLHEIAANKAEQDLWSEATSEPDLR